MHTCPAISSEIGLSDGRCVQFSASRCRSASAISVAYNKDPQSAQSAISARWWDFPTTHGGFRGSALTGPSARCSSTSRMCEASSAASPAHHPSRKENRGRQRLGGAVTYLPVAVGRFGSCAPSTIV